MYRKNTSGQFVHFQGVDATTGGIKSGVTWTMRRCIDGTFAAGGATITEDSTNGWYKAALTQADTNGNNIAYNFTGTGAVPQTVNIVTTAADPTDAVHFGLSALPNTACTTNASLLTSGTGTDQLSVASGRVDIGKLLGTAWLTPGTAGTPDVNVKLWNGLTTVALPLVPTTAGRTLDVSAGGEAGVDWANVGSQSTSVNLSGTTVNLCNTCTTVTNQLTAAAIATGVWTDTTAGDFTTALSVGKSLMNGVSLGTGLTVASVSGAVGSVTGAVGSVTGAVGSVTGAVGSVTGAVGSVTGNVGGNVVGSVASVSGAVGSVTGNVGGNVVGSVGSLTTNNDKTGYALTSAYDFAKGTVAVTESYASDGSAPTPIQALMLIQQMLTESSVASTTLTVKKVDGSSTAATFTLNDGTAPTSITRSG